LNIDIAPTLFEIAGVSAPKEIHGRSLIPLCVARKFRGATRF
jgi:arylsulfatase A-like enzyme